MYHILVLSVALDLKILLFYLLLELFSVLVVFDRLFQTVLVLYRVEVLLALLHTSIDIIAEEELVP